MFDSCSKCNLDGGMTGQVLGGWSTQNPQPLLLFLASLFVIHLLTFNVEGIDSAQNILLRGTGHSLFSA